MSAPIGGVARRQSSTGGPTEQPRGERVHRRRSHGHNRIFAGLALRSSQNQVSVFDESLRVNRIGFFGDLRHVLDAEGVVVTVHDELAAEAWPSLERDQDVGTLCRLAHILEERAVGPMTHACHHEIGSVDAVSEEE